MVDGGSLYRLPLRVAFYPYRYRSQRIYKLREQRSVPNSRCRLSFSPLPRIARFSFSLPRIKIRGNGMQNYFQQGILQASRTPTYGIESANSFLSSRGSEFPPPSRRFVVHLGQQRNRYLSLAALRHSLNHPRRWSSTLPLIPLSLDNCFSPGKLEYSRVTVFGTRKMAVIVRTACASVWKGSEGGKEEGEGSQAK